MADRSVQGQFVITSIAVSPGTVNLQIPKNYEKTINITATTGKGTTAENLHIAYDTDDQPGGVLPEGVHVTLPAAVSSSSDEKITLPVNIWADNSADSTGKLVLKVKSDESGDDAWGTVSVNLAGTPVNAGQTYAWILDGYVAYSGISQYAAVAVDWPDPYKDGSYLSSGSFVNHTTTREENFADFWYEDLQYDMSFLLEYQTQ